MRMRCGQKNLGLTVDLSGVGVGLGVGTDRFAVVLDDLQVKYIGVEDSVVEVEVSGVNTVLQRLE